MCVLGGVGYDHVPCSRPIQTGNQPTLSSPPELSSSDNHQYHQSHLNCNILIWQQPISLKPPITGLLLLRSKGHPRMEWSPSNEVNSIFTILVSYTLAKFGHLCLSLMMYVVTCYNICFQSVTFHPLFFLFPFSTTNHFLHQAPAISSPAGESTRSKGAVRETRIMWWRSTDHSCVIMREHCDGSMKSIVTIVTRLQVCYIYTGLKSRCQIQTIKYTFANICSIC